MRTVQPPSSKSLSHRMLIATALAEGTSHVRHVLHSEDIVRTRALLAAAGARIEPCDQDAMWRVCGMGGLPQGGTIQAPLDCDVHESGTTCRILAAVLAAGRGVFRFHGAGRMHSRPIAALVNALRSLGVTVQYEADEGCPPLLIHTEGFQQDTVTIGLDESSQYLSGLLLAAPLAPEGLRIAVAGEKVVSWPYVALTLQIMEAFGLAFDVLTRQQGKWEKVDWRNVKDAQPHALCFHVPHGTYRSGDYAVEGDWSAASYLLAAGAVGRESVCVRGLRTDSFQGDRTILDILRQMGAVIREEPEGIVVVPSALHGIDVDMGACPDLVPTVAVLAAFATGETRIRNVAHLRIKESDRIAAPAQELAKVGVRVEPLEDGLRLWGTSGRFEQTQVAQFSAHGDHRIAMSLALLECAGLSVPLDDISVVRKSFPDFWDVWRTLR